MTRNLRSLPLVATLVVALALVFWFRPAEASQISPQRVITVQGEAEMLLPPDTATLGLGVEVEKNSAKDAQKENAALMNEVVSALERAGISKENMQTSDFRLNPVYNWVDNGSRQVLRGYRCANSLTVVVEDTKNIGAVIDAAIGAGANTVGSLVFGVKDSSSLEDEILAKAVENARHKAEVMAEAAGVTITGVLNISDGFTSVGVDNYVRGNVMLQDALKTSIEPGTVTLNANVRVEFGF